MKRDIDLIREILLKVEEEPYRYWDLGIELEINGYSEEGLSYHVLLLKEAGLVEARTLATPGSRFLTYLPQRLTWAGHEFLDASRDDTIWEKAKSRLLEKSGGLAFDVLKALLIELGRQAVGLEPAP